jgi:hypothetical protein
MWMSNWSHNLKKKNQKIMPPHLIEREQQKWKKNEWKTTSPDLTIVITVCRRIRINKTRRIAEELGIKPIYPSDDDDLAYKETRPDA